MEKHNKYMITALKYIVALSAILLIIYSTVEPIPRTEYPAHNIDIDNNIEISNTNCSYEVINNLNEEISEYLSNHTVLKKYNVNKNQINSKCVHEGEDKSEIIIITIKFNPTIGDLSFIDDITTEEQTQITDDVIKLLKDNGVDIPGVIFTHNFDENI